MVYFPMLSLYNSNIMITHNYAVAQGEAAPAVLFSSLKIRPGLSASLLPVLHCGSPPKEEHSDLPYRP